MYNINKLPSSALHHKTLTEILLNKKPDYDSSHPFGCAVFPCLTPYNKQKLQFHSKECAFIGYNNNQKGYKCLSPDGRVYMSRHVIFNHSEFNFLSLFCNTSSSSYFQTDQQSSFPFINNHSLPDTVSYLPSTAIDQSLAATHRSVSHSQHNSTENFLNSPGSSPSDSSTSSNQSSTRYMLA